MLNQGLMNKFRRINQLIDIFLLSSTKHQKHLRSALRIIINSSQNKLTFNYISLSQCCEALRKPAEFWIYHSSANAFKLDEARSNLGSDKKEKGSGNSLSRWGTRGARGGVEGRRGGGRSSERPGEALEMRRNATLDIRKDFVAGVKK
jgi:hypothetical protein